MSDMKRLEEIIQKEVAAMEQVLRDMKADRAMINAALKKSQHDSETALKYAVRAMKDRAYVLARIKANEDRIIDIGHDLHDLKRTVQKMPETCFSGITNREKIQGITSRMDLIADAAKDRRAHRMTWISVVIAAGVAAWKIIETVANWIYMQGGKP